MSFDRTKSVDYAKRFWDRPCDDGVFWLTDQEINVARKRKELHAPAADRWEARFIPQQSVGGEISEQAAFIRSSLGGASIPNMPGLWEIITISGWEGLADCAHYLSLCLQAGGTKIFSLRVRELVAKLQARSDTITVAERATKDRAQQVIDSGVFKPGDMIGYYNIDPTGGDYGRTNSYTHSTMFVGKIDSSGNADAADAGRITCHTMSRFGHGFWGDEWWLHDHYSYTLIHLSADDPAPSPTMTNLLAGWWKIEVSGRTEYQLYSSSRTVQSTIYSPKSGKDPIKSPQDRGRWWETAPNHAVTIFPKTTTVIHWPVADAAKTEQSITVAGVAGKATKLF
jgi:hypothetical protein